MRTLTSAIVTAREAAHGLAQLRDHAATGAPIVITRHGKPAAVVLDPALWDDVPRLRAREADHLRALADLAAARADAGAALPAAQVRAQMAAWLAAHDLPPLPPGEDRTDYLDRPADPAG